MSFLKVLAHEIGHALGMHHSHHNGGSIMYKVVPTRFPVRLYYDDIAGIQSIYR